MPRSNRNHNDRAFRNSDMSRLSLDIEKSGKVTIPKVTTNNGRKTRLQRKLEDGRVMLRCECKRTRRLVNSATGAKLYCPKCPGFMSRTDQQTTS